MKKLLAWCMAMLLCLSAAACGPKGPEPIPLELDTPYEVQETAQLKLVSITSDDVVQSTMGGGIYYENTTDGHLFVDVVFDVTNLSAEPIDSQALMTAVAANQDKDVYKSVLYCVETHDMTYVAQQETIAPMATVRFHAGISVPETESALQLTFTVAGQEQPYTIDYTVGTAVKNTTPLAVGDVIGDEAYATVKYLGYEMADAILPSNTQSVYAFYDVDSADNTYLAVSFEVTNYQSEANDMDRFVSCRAIFQDKYEYTGFIITENSDGTGFDAAGYIHPLSPTHLLCLIEVPDTVADADFTVSVMFDKQEYSIRK